MIKLQQIFYVLPYTQFLQLLSPLVFTLLHMNGMTSPSTESLLWALAIVAGGT